MEKKFKLGVIGAGFMATAIIKGVIGAKVLTPNEISVTDVNQTALDRIAELNVKTFLTAKELAESSEYILFAVKPQNAVEVFTEICVANPKKIISIMAGVKKEKIKKYLNDALVARCMPNTPCSLGKGVIGVDISDFNGEDEKFILKLLNSFSKTVNVPEKLMSAVTGVSGSSPAYFYYFIKSIIECGVKNGLSEEQAKTLAVETMIGSAEMIKNNNDKSLDELINAVCSKGGTTIEAVKTFNENNLGTIIEKGVQACIDRSVELEKL